MSGADQMAIDFSSRSLTKHDLDRVRRIIEGRRGRNAAISMEEIYLRTGIGDRRGRLIQEIVKRLVEDEHLPIGTSARPPYGYFWIVTEAERRECRNHFMRRAISILEHAKAYDSDSIVGPLVGQLRIELGEPSEEK